MSPPQQARLSSLGDRGLSVLHTIEELAATLALAAMVILPLAEIVIRPLVAGGIPGSIPFVQHLTLWVAFLGAALAARRGKLIALATATFIPEGRARRVTQVFAAAVGTMVCAILARSAIDVVVIEREIGGDIALGIPTWVAQLVLPVSLAVIAFRLMWGAGGWTVRSLAGAALVAGVLLSQSFEVLNGDPGWPWVVLVVVAALAGAPIFTVLGGAAVFLYMTEAIEPATVPLYAYHLATEPHLPAIPLFTLAGFILSQGNASERLLRAFRALVGWMPGGDGCGVRGGVRLYHDFHRWIRRDDPGGGRAPSAGIAQGWVSRSVLSRVADSFRVAGPAPATCHATYSLRDHRGDHARRSVHRRASCQACC